MLLRWIMIVALGSMAACSSRIECPAGKKPEWVLAPHLPGGAVVECR